MAPDSLSFLTLITKLQRRSPFRVVHELGVSVLSTTSRKIPLAVLHLVI